MNENLGLSCCWQGLSEIKNACFYSASHSMALSPLMDVKCNLLPNEEVACCASILFLKKVIQDVKLICFTGTDKFATEKQVHQELELCRPALEPMLTLP